MGGGRRIDAVLDEHFVGEAMVGHKDGWAEPMQRVTMGPWLEWRLLMTSSSSEKDWWSYWNLPRMGTMEGQRGSCWVLELFLVRIRWLSKIEMQREMRMRDQVSMFLVLSLISMLLELSGTRVRDS
jgi:hypothetical protein